MTCRFATGKKYSTFWILILMQDELVAKPASSYVPGHCVKKLSQDACPPWKTTAFRGPQCSTVTNSPWTTTCVSLRSQTRMGLGLVREHQSPYRPAMGQGDKPEKTKVRLFHEGLFFSYLILYAPSYNSNHVQYSFLIQKKRAKPVIKKRKPLEGVEVVVRTLGLEGVSG